MRRRLTLAIVSLVVGTLVGVGVASYLLIRHNSVEDARQQLVTQVGTVAANPQALVLRRAQRTPAHPICCVALLRVLGGYTTLSVVGIDPSGHVVGALPPSLAGQSFPVGQLLSAQPVSGAAGDAVYALSPIELTAGQTRRLLPGFPSREHPVLLGTRDVAPPLDGFGYFLLIAALAIAAATGLAWWLSHRFSRPLLDAVSVTGRIADGDLGARMPAPRTDPGPAFARSHRGHPDELTLLATGVNTMADSLVRARRQQRQFLLSISHDLRTPLTSIRGYAEALVDGTAPDPAGAADVISTEAGQLERLVRDLLELAQLDARRFSLHAAPIDAAEVVRDTVARFRQTAWFGPVAIRAEVPEGPELWITSDGDRLGQLLANLVENAGKFARSEVIVGGRAVPDPTGGDAVELWVTDDGPGIPAEDLPRLFEPAFSPDGAGRRDGTGQREGRGPRGSGLGLAIVSELASLLGGRIEARSPLGPDGGTRFSLHLPERPHLSSAPA